MVIQTVRLDQIHDVEFIYLTFSGVTNTEVEPLRELLHGAMIELQL